MASITMPQRPRSGGCLTCKSRKVKCDEARPICLRCIQAGRTCEGYQDKDDFVFRDEAPKLRQKYESKKIHVPLRERRRQISHTTGTLQAAEESSTTSDSTDVILPRKVSFDIELESLGLFMRSYVRQKKVPGRRLVGFYHLLPSVYRNMSVDSCLDRSVTAAALIYLAKWKESREIWIRAMKAYGRAVKSVNKALSDPTLALADETLLATDVLALYETLTDKNSIKAWYGHTLGTASLLRMRGTSQLGSETGVSLFLLSASRLHTLCFVHRRQVFPWMNAMEKLIPRDNLAVDVGPTIMRIPELMEKFDQVKLAITDDDVAIQGYQGVLNELVDMDLYLEQWIAALPKEWLPTIVIPMSHSLRRQFDKEDQPNPMWEEYHSFCDDWTCFGLTCVRTARIYLQRLKLDCFQQLKSLSKSQIEFKHAHDDSMINSCRIVRVEANKICCAFAYLMGYEPPNTESSSVDDACNWRNEWGALANARGVGGYYSIWPLNVLTRQAEDILMEHQRKWLLDLRAFIMDARGMGKTWLGPGKIV